MCLAALDQCFPWEVIIEPVVGILLSSIVFSTASIAPNSRYFEGLLLVFDSATLESALWQPMTISLVCHQLASNFLF